MASALARNLNANDDAAVEAVIRAGRDASVRGWVPATSGNFSIRIDPARIAITRSGVDKGSLRHGDILIQSIDQPLLPGSSAEAALHVRLYAEHRDIGAVFHTHGLYASVIGQAHAASGAVHLSGWELQKALSGIRTHDTTVEVPVFANDQDVAALGTRVSERFARPTASGHSRAPGYLIAGHGLYAWGQNAVDAHRHIEALEVLFSQAITLRSYQP